MGQNPNRNKKRKVLDESQAGEFMVGYRKQMKSEIDSEKTPTKYNDPAKGNKRQVGIRNGETYTAPTYDEESTIRDVISGIIEEVVEKWRDYHSAPSADHDNPEEKVENGDVFSLTEIAQGYMTIPDDYFSRNGPRFYGYNNLFGNQSLAAIGSVIRGVQSTGRARKITAYRAVPNGIQDKLQKYDWISFSNGYAMSHGENRHSDDYHLIEQVVSSDEVWWDENDINEWGYDPS